MDTENIYYCYIWKREDGTPYYIGKGKGGRYKRKRRGVTAPPKDLSNIFFACEGVTESEAFEMEVALISLLGRKDLGTGILRNQTVGGDGTSGYAHTEETRRKMCEKKRNISDETRRKLIESHKGNRHSEESKRKMSVARRGERNPNYGKPCSEETRRKIGEANSKPKKVTEEQQLEIYQRWRNGETYKQLAVDYSVHFNTIGKIIAKLNKQLSVQFSQQ